MVKAQARFESFPTVWVLVADGRRARIFQRASRRELKPLVEREHEEKIHLTNKEQGRTFDSYGEGHHKLEPHTDWKQYEKDVFAREMAKLIEDAYSHEKFDRLVLIAPPATLGDLRSHLSKQVQKKLAAEIHKDLTHNTPQEIAKVLVEENIGFLE